MGTTTKLGRENPGKKRKQRSKRTQFIMKSLKWFIILFVIVSFAFTGIAIGTIYGWVRSAAPVTDDQLQLKNLTSIVCDKDGNEIWKLTGSENIDRVLVHDRDENIPKNLKNAFIAIEDERFNKHNGFDLRGFIRAAVKKFTDPGNREGASTITMQLVKNVTGSDDYALKRKVQEIWRAMDLEKRYEKWEILESYMNTIPMGGNTYGVQAASLKYFGKEVKDLDLAECASLAGITQNPNRFKPTTDEKKEYNKERQKLVLSRMLANELISQAEYDQAINEELKFDVNLNILRQNDKLTVQTAKARPYLVDQVLKDVAKDLKAEGYTDEFIQMNLYNGGFTIRTTMDSGIQRGMDEVFNDEDYFPGGERDGEKPQAAMVIIDPSSGQVRAMYGGNGEKTADSVFNRATQLKRQAGSSFKPIAVYAPALDQRLITPATVIDDVPSHMDPMNKDKIYPRNYPEIIDGKLLRNYQGLVSVRVGVAHSINVVAAKIFKDILTPELSFKYIEKSGIDLDEKHDTGVSVSLGGLYNGVSPLDMAAGYVPFDNEGVYIEPITYTSVEDKDGNKILDKLDKDKFPKIKQQKRIVYDEKAAYVMTDILTSVVKRGGTASYVPFQNSKGQYIPIAAKTGTSNNERDRWFVGYSPYYVGAVWYGYDNYPSVPTMNKNPSAVIWKAVMEKAHKGLDAVSFKMPPGIVKKKVCKYSGKLPTGLCSKDPRGNAIVEEVFIKGTEPKDGELCDTHISLAVDKKSKDIWGRNLLAGPNCPRENIVSKVFIHRKVPFLPRNPGEPYPDDWKYSDPGGEFCNLH